MLQCSVLVALLSVYVLFVHRHEYSNLHRANASRKEFLTEASNVCFYYCCVQSVCVLFAVHPVLLIHPSDLFRLVISSLSVIETKRKYFADFPIFQQQNIPTNRNTIKWFQCSISSVDKMEILHIAHCTTGNKIFQIVNCVRFENSIQFSVFTV